jgi:hypothetical protein
MTQLKKSIHLAVTSGSIYCIGIEAIKLRDFSILNNGLYLFIISYSYYMVKEKKDRENLKHQEGKIF